jgi:hypothetical protein
MLKCIAVACSQTELYQAQRGHRVYENTEEAEYNWGGEEISANE